MRTLAIAIRHHPRPSGLPLSQFAPLDAVRSSATSLAGPSAPSGSRPCSTVYCEPASLHPSAQHVRKPEGRGRYNQQDCHRHRRLSRRQMSTADRAIVWCTPTEQNQAKLLHVAKQKRDRHAELLAHVSIQSTQCWKVSKLIELQDETTLSIQGRKDRARFLKQYGPLSSAWTDFQHLRKVSPQNSTSYSRRY